jgi:hypothetical protein
MKIALAGLANAGKTTIFNALTGLDMPTTVYPTTDLTVHLGVVKVPDARIDALSAIYKPKKTTYATIQYIDTPGFTPGDKIARAKIFDAIRNVDAIVHVARSFDNEAVSAALDKVDPAAEQALFASELIFEDYELVEKRLQRIEDSQKRGKKTPEQDVSLLLKCKDALEKEIPLRDVEFTQQEQLLMKAMQFISLKPLIIVLNVAEQDLGKPIVNELRQTLQNQALNTPVVAICGKIEMELAQLSEQEAKEFLQELAIDEPALSKLIHTSFERLNLISFITVGDDEVRAWTIPANTNAQQAAGKIHSDIERGFIRAEVVAYDDFMKAGGMVAAKEVGAVRLEGKLYLVQDGDIINFRFNV